MTLPSVNPSARVQRIPNPIASPGQCGICGKNEHPEGFADARLDFEFYGTLIFCRDCAGEIASVFGYHAPEDLIALREQVEDQNAELNTLRQAILGLESAVDGLTNYRDLRGNSSHPRGRRPERPAVEDVNEEPVDSEQDEPVADSVPAESPNDGAEQESNADKPAREQGRDDVRGVTSELSADVDELLGLS